MDEGAASVHPTRRAGFVFFAVFFAALLAVTLALITSTSTSTTPIVAPATAQSGALASAASIASTSTSTSSDPREPVIHLRGVARIDAHVARSDGKLVLRGTVTDDVGADLPGARVAIQIATAPEGASLPSDAKRGASAPYGPFVSFASLAAEVCADGAQPPVLEGPTRLVVATSAADSAIAGPARFCLRIALPLPPGRYVARLEARPSGLIDGSQLDLPVDLTVAAVSLRFDREDPFLSLDEPTIAVRVVASIEDDGISRAAADLPLFLSNESAQPLGNATTDASGRAIFTFAGALSGPAGLGELRVAFAGNSRIGASSYVSRVERRTHVELRMPDATDERLPAGSPEAGIALRVVAKATCAARGCKGTPTGTVEVHVVGAEDADDHALVAGTVAGAAALRDGEASVVASLARPEEGGGLVTLITLRARYIPDVPWFLPSESAPFVQPLRPASHWSVVVLVGSGLLVIVWFATGRLWQETQLSVRSAARLERGVQTGDTRDARETRERPEGTSGADAAGREGVEISSAISSGASFLGRVVDAHVGSPIVGARVAIERPGFERAEVLVETLSDDAGSFVLTRPGVPGLAGLAGLAGDDGRDRLAIMPGDWLVAEGKWHRSVRVPLPPMPQANVASSACVLRVTLVARRRAVLDRLVGWARQRGRPFDAAPEPTPAHVGRIARSSGTLSSGGASGERPQTGTAPSSGARVADWAEAVERAAYGGEPVDARREAEIDRLAPTDAPANGEVDALTSAAAAHPRVDPGSRPR